MTFVVHAVRSVIAPFTRTRLFRQVAPRALPVAERVMKRLTGGRVLVSGLLVPSLVLHSVGARSGEGRSVELMYTPDGLGRAIVAGTSFAREHHPGWTYNLLANPDAEITTRGKRMRVRAKLISDPDEREAAWATIQKQWPGYREYERESGRTVRLFLLRPIVPELEVDQTAAPRPEEGIADVLRAKPDVEDHSQHPGRQHPRRTDR